MMITAFVADAKVLSRSAPKVTQVRIVHAVKDPAAQPSSWGIDSSFIGPGDIRRLVSIDIYLDSYSRIAAVKIVRQTTVGDTVTQLFADVTELSIETLKEGADRPFKDVPVTVQTADGLTFPN
ncbi:MAG: hypothetical protein HY751_08075 [Nitrospinae bacterium]|nr:hypothetical protein [Nitrospinota bacterium]